MGKRWKQLHRSTNGISYFASSDEKSKLASLRISASQDFPTYLQMIILLQLNSRYRTESTAVGQLCMYSYTISLGFKSRSQAS